MATIERRRSTHGQRYRVRVRLHDSRSQSQTFATLQEARHWASLTEATLRTERTLPYPEASRQTLQTLADRYSREVLPRISAGTARYQARHLAWWQTQLGHLRLLELTPARLVECREQLARTRSPGTVNGYLTTLGRALAVAVREWQWLEDSPMARVQKLRLPTPPTRYLTDDERQRLLAACQQSHNRLLYPVVVLALATGARKMELLGLTWGDVDWHRERVLFRDTKNQTPRVVPLAPVALEVLRTVAKVRRLDTPLLFPRTDGRQPIDLRYAWAQTLQQAGMPEGFRFHDLRHSAASYLAMNGASLVEIAEILGHKTLAMVKRYAHLSESHTRTVLTRMTATIFGS
jgi:integrase